MADVRRVGFFPPIEFIQQLEGVVVVDAPPPAQISGAASGTVCLVGEYADMTYACQVSAVGVVTSRLRPIEVFSPQDLLDKVGGWDETLGKFGSDGGSAWEALRSKKFARLICCPVDLCTSSDVTATTALRMWRSLPTCTSATDPNPITPVLGATVPAGREFLTGAQRIRLCARYIFSGDFAYAQGIAGSVTLVGVPATTQLVTLTGADVVALGVSEGDALVLGVIDGAAGLGTNAATYRVVAVAPGAVVTNLTVEKLDGSAFDWVTHAAMPWRLHVAAAFDTGGEHQLSELAGYTVLARPLDSTVATATSLAAVSPATNGSASSWDALSDLVLRTQPAAGGAALYYDADLHAPNAATNAALRARYQSALDALLSDDYPSRDVNIVWCARKDATIRTALRTHALTASSRGLTRREVVSPTLTQVSVSTVIGDASPGVGANRSERQDYAWPGLKVFVPEAVGFTVTLADGTTTTDGILDTSADGWLVAIMSNLPPERNPGQMQAPVPEVMSPVLGLQSNGPVLGQNEYIQLRAKGVCAPRNDRISGWGFQSGVTTSLTAGEKNISRRRMADFIQDSIAGRLAQFAKLPGTRANHDASTSEVVAFLEGLLSPGNAAAQRIDGYMVDDRSGNTPATSAAGIHVIIVRVRLTPTDDFIVLQTEIGESVTITQQ